MVRKLVIRSLEVVETPDIKPILPDRENGRDVPLVDHATEQIGHIDPLPLRNARVALSSFLWRPGREIEDRPAIVAAADLRVVGTSRERQTRLGYTLHGVNRGAREQGGFVSTRVDRLEVRAAYLVTDAGARSAERLRTGLTLFYARFAVGIGREEGVSGLGPVYQFTLRSLLR